MIGRGPSCGACPSSSEALESLLLEEANRLRTSGAHLWPVGSPPLSPLRWHEQLAEVARAHSRAMVDEGFFDHVDNHGRVAGDRLSQAGFVWSHVGEVISAGHATAAATVEGWSRSEGHLRVLIDPNVIVAGAGHVHTCDGPYRDFWTLVVARPMDVP